MAKVFFVRNEKDLPFADWIVDGVKVIETRNRRTLSALAGTGERVYIARTGHGKPVVIGTCVLSIPYHCPVESFGRCRFLHKVPAGSKYDAGPAGKWFYDIWDAERVEPFDLPADAIRHGRVWAEFNLEEA